MWPDVKIKIAQKLPKRDRLLSSCYLKVMVSKMAQVTKFWAILTRNLLPRTLKKWPIWSHLNWRSLFLSFQRKWSFQAKWEVKLSTGNWREEKMRKCHVPENWELTRGTVKIFELQSCRRRRDGKETSQGERSGTFFTSFGSAIFSLKIMND